MHLFTGTFTAFVQGQERFSAVLVSQNGEETARHLPTVLDLGRNVEGARLGIRGSSSPSEK